MTQRCYFRSYGKLSIPGPTGQPLDWGANYVHVPSAVIDVGIGFTALNWWHAEANAAALLRMLATQNPPITQAVLYVTPKPCTLGGLGCGAQLVLGKMLPAGTTVILNGTNSEVQGQGAPKISIGEIYTGTGP